MASWQYLTHATLLVDSFHFDHDTKPKHLSHVILYLDHLHVDFCFCHEYNLSVVLGM
ncbi:unnamed protein product [Schistosoma curassoni]|uniref:Uncharacterized protein n=1 Tax=Schistosoma curassoni TaxID=6186 RepID=A0A183KQK3_9TREM|nr:unnamed protein product [Schistosoma curassoni]